MFIHKERVEKKKKMSFKSIPILDLSLADDPATKPGLLSDLRYALMEVGFLYIKNVGIPEELFKKVITEGRAFFDIPLEEKSVIIFLYFFSYILYIHT